MRALAPVVGESGVQRSGIEVLTERLEPDGVWTELDVSPFHHRLVDGDGRLFLACPGHRFLLRVGYTQKA